MFEVTIHAFRNACDKSIKKYEQNLWFIILIVGTAIIHAALIVGYWIRAIKNLKKLQQRFRRKVEKEELLKDDIH